MKKIICLIACLFSTSVFAAKTLHFATEATYPPFEYVDESGKIQGFDIDIVNALCQRMKTECTFSNQSFASLIPSLKLGKYDGLAAALGITPERQKQVAFTNPYYEPSASFIAPTEKNYHMADIKGKTIGVQAGSTLEKYLQDTYGKQVTIKTYASIQEALLDLIANRVDIVLADTALAQNWLKKVQQGNVYNIIDKPIYGSNYFGEGYGIAVRQDNKELLDALNKALSEIKANGTYNKIVKKYFG